jgi:hypothetical protein
VKRLVTLLTGIGALIALGVMVALVAIGPDDDGDPAAGGSPFPPGALTVAVQDDQLPIVSPELIAGRIDRIAASGVRFTRVDVFWVEIAANRPAAPRDPSDPAYSWSRYDAIIDGLSARGIEPIVAFSRAPGWANGDKGPEWSPDGEAYSAFVRAFATRYSGGAHARVRLFEPWNEPNNPLAFMPQWERSGAQLAAASPARYADLLRRAWTEAKAVSAQSQVIGLSLAHVETSAPPAGGISATDFIQALVADAPPMDAAAIHLAPDAGPNSPSEAIPSFATLPRLVQDIDRVAAGVPVMVTQFGFATPPGGLSEADQAAYLTQSLDRLAAIPRIRLGVWFSLQDTPERPSGLMRLDGSEKPSWVAFVASPKALPSAAGP